MLVFLSTDTKFLLAILRRAKFSQLVARQLIDNILTIRTKHPKMTVNYDIQDPCTMAYIDAGLVAAAGSGAIKMTLRRR